MNVREIFEQAIQISDASARASFLQQACGDDQALRTQVEALLAADDSSEDLFMLPLADMLRQSEGQDVEASGVELGPFRLLHQIGEGGMGTVFLAEQQQPVRRRVAVKITRQGLAHDQIVTRFETERQALALMDHPHIARFLDVGTTADGRPYFVMEFVDGVPITEYCDTQRLTPLQRLELFLPVCAAVQHAHQKSVVHRDIKPSNVLVTTYDGRPTPKIIDFGLAKALKHPWSQETQLTHFGQVLGTLGYMSPEQAEVNTVDIDTRTDVYALGVLLYELLTGTIPLEASRIKAVAVDRVLQLIREEEPPRPSTRLSQSSDTLPRISAARRTPPKRLGQLLRGDLDTIVMKTLEKDRSRRYHSASALAADLQRYLLNDPLEARPPSTAYRWRKLARKHRSLVTAIAVLALLLVGGTAVTTVLAMRATRAELQAQLDASLATSINTFLNQDLLVQADPYVSPDRHLKLRSVLDRAASRIDGRFDEQPLVEANLRATIGWSLYALGEYARAQPQLERALELNLSHRGPAHESTLTAQNNLGITYAKQQLFEQAEPLLQQALESARRTHGEEHPTTQRARRHLHELYEQRTLQLP